MIKRFLSLLLPLIVLSVSLIIFYRVVAQKESAEILHTQITVTPSVPSPTPFVFESYTAPNVSRKDVYKIAMIGDSMTAALGPHGGGMSEYINKLYKENSDSPQRIIIDNYAKSSSILAVNDQLTLKTTINEYTFEPLLTQEFDLILVESFAYNPLSQFGDEDGLKKQTEELDKLMTTLVSTHPNTHIVFVATIAPNRQNFAKTLQANNSAEERAMQADERISYLKNHIEYARSHDIPLINIYEKSLTANGDGNFRYINSTDDIHPSFVGVEFIGHEISNFIFENKILIP